MLVSSLVSIYERDLNRLKQEIEGYTDEDKLWIVSKDIKNSAGNLCLHLIGNLNTYIGAVLGHSDYIRNRENEFSLKHIPAKDLLRSIDETRAMVKKTLSSLTEQDLEKDYPIVVFEQEMSTAYFLIHLATHLAYHLGQINYHRRLH